MKICAHRGFHHEYPENTIAAFQAAMEFQADEIEFDLWPTKDKKLLVCHDSTIDRTSSGKGKISDLSSVDLQALEFEKPEFALPYFSEVLQQFGNKIEMNIHIKSPETVRAYPEAMKKRGQELRRVYTENILYTDDFPDPEEYVIEEMEQPRLPYDEEIFDLILNELDRFHCRDSVYITGERDVMETARKMAPDISRCNLEGHMNFTIVKHAVEFGCKRLQFCKTCLTRRMIDEAREHGLICNLFWSDDLVEAKMFYELGIDVVLANRPLL